MRLNEFASGDSGGGSKFISWKNFIEQLKEILAKDFDVKESIIKDTIKAKFIPHDPMEFGPTMLYSYYERRAGRDGGAVGTRGAIQVGQYFPSTRAGESQLLTGFSILKGHPFERHFDLTFENLYKIANIIKGNTKGAYQMQSQGVAEGSEKEGLVSEFLKSISPKELKYYSIRDNCGPAALHMKDWAKTQGIDLKRHDGYFVADNVVYDKLDFTKEMKRDFLKQGLDFNNPTARKEFIESNPEYSEEWKKVPHYWLQDNQGNIYDPTGYIQFIKTGLSSDLDSWRYMDVKSVAEATGDEEFDTMLSKITSPTAVNAQNREDTVNELIRTYFWHKRRADLGPEKTHEHGHEKIVLKILKKLNRMGIDLAKVDPVKLKMIKSQVYEQGVAEGAPQPGKSSGKPISWMDPGKIVTKYLTLNEILKSIPGIPYYNDVVGDRDKKDFTWGVTKRVIQYAKELIIRPDSYKNWPPIIVLDGKLLDGAHRISTM